MSPPVLHIPVLGEPFVVRMDASNTHIGAVFGQSGQPVTYFSHKLSPTECKVNSGLYGSQKTGASVYPATVEPPLDTLGGEAS